MNYLMKHNYHKEITSNNMKIMENQINFMYFKTKV